MLELERVNGLLCETRTKLKKLPPCTSVQRQSGSLLMRLQIAKRLETKK